MYKLPRSQVDPTKVMIDTLVRLESKTILEDFKVKVPPFPPRQSAVIVMDYGFAKMVYTQKNEVHFLCSLKDWPQLIEGLQAYLKECKRPRINQMNLPTVVFSASDYCHEFAAIAEAHDLDGGLWNVYNNRFLTYSL